MEACSKYVIEMFVSIAPNWCLLTPCLSEQFKWGFFGNWRSGVGNNIEDDLAQEISNRCSKSITQRQGPNKTLKSIGKVCKATTGTYQIIQEFGLSVGIHKTSVEHTTRDSLKDEKEMVHNLLQLNPFHYMSASCHDSLRVKGSKIINLFTDVIQQCNFQCFSLKFVNNAKFHKNLLQALGNVRL